MEYKVNAPAKINLSLDITGKREDGYHLLSTVMQSINLSDIITIRLDNLIDSVDEKIIVSTDKGYIPSDNRNTAFRAAELFMKRYEQLINVKNSNQNFKPAPDRDVFVFNKVEINIEKNIPVQAGLGGGSSDAAGVLVGLNQITGKVFSEEEIIDMGVLIGADVPFCIRGGTVLCEGIGEIMTPLKDLPEIDILVIKPDFGVSTPWIFKNYKPELVMKRPDTGKVIKSIENSDISNLFLNTANVLEDITVINHPGILMIKKTLIQYGALFSMMSGSGSAVFGVFPDNQSAKDAYRKIAIILKHLNPSLFLTKTTNKGPVLVKNTNPY